jgi:hypothetical protein
MRQEKEVGQFFLFHWELDIFVLAVYVLKNKFFVLKNLKPVD